MRRRRHLFSRVISYFLLFLVVLGVTGVAIGVNLYRAMGSKGDIAKIEISLNGTTLADMKNGEKETRYGGNQVAVLDGIGEKNYADVEIKGRGNVNWLFQDKKPWQLKFTQKTELLGISKAKKWVLITNALDPSYIRSDLAMKLASITDEAYNYRGKFAEVYFDEENEGVFYVLPKVSIGKGSVDLRNDLGVIVELDNLHQIEGEAFYRSYAGNMLTLKDAVSKNDDETTNLAMNDFLKSYNALEMAAENRDFETANEVADLESLAKYYLVSEFTVNPDAYSSSFYFYKDGEADKVHAGPLWDFDLAFGNTEWAESQNPNYYSPRETMARRNEALGINNYGKVEQISGLIYRLMDMPEFQELVKEVYRERMAGRKSELINETRQVVEAIRYSAIEDSKKWNRGDFDTEVEKVLNWVEMRYDYFEEVYGDNAPRIEESVI